MVAIANVLLWIRFYQKSLMNFVQLRLVRLACRLHTRQDFQRLANMSLCLVSRPRPPTASLSAPSIKLTRRAGCVHACGHTPPPFNPAGELLAKKKAHKKKQTPACTNTCLTALEPHPKLTFVGAFQTVRNGLETPAELLCTADVFVTVKHCVKWKTKTQWSAFRELRSANQPAEYVMSFLKRQ